MPRVRACAGAIAGVHGAPRCGVPGLRVRDQGSGLRATSLPTVQLIGAGLSLWRYLAQSLMDSQTHAVIYLAMMPRVRVLVQVLSRVFMARTDVAFQVRGAAVHVWKTLVGNTPKTLGEILPVLMQQLITSLASQGGHN